MNLETCSNKSKGQITSLCLRLSAPISRICLPLLEALLNRLVRFAQSAVILTIDCQALRPWQFLYFLPEPHGQGSLRPIRGPDALIG